MNECPTCKRSVDVLYEFMIVEGLYSFKIKGCDDCSKRDIHKIQEMAQYQTN